MLQTKRQTKYYEAEFTIEFPEEKIGRILDFTFKDVKIAKAKSRLV
ncbi:hypothetical protein [Flavobacterium flavigenum]|nr:hypothetical protein [Flavobacterium flavigenum]